MAPGYVLLPRDGVVGGELVGVVFDPVGAAAVAVVLGRQGARIETVAVALPVIIRIDTFDRQPLERGELDGDRIGGGETVLEILVEAEGDGRIVEPGPGLVQVVDDGIGTEQRVQIGRAGPVVGAPDGRLVVQVLTVQEVGGIGDLQPGCDLVGDGETGGHPPVAAVLDDALDVAIPEGGIPVGRLGAGAHRQVVLLVGSHPGDGIHPVGPRPVGERIGEGISRPQGIVRIVVRHLVAEQGELGGIHRIQPARKARDAGLQVQGDPGLGDLRTPLPGGHDDDAVGTLCPVDGRGRGVLQDGDGLDIGGIDVAEVLHGVDDPVHDDERLVGGRDGARPPDADGGRRRRVARGRHDVGAGHAALQRLVDGGYGRIGDIRHLDMGHGACQVGLAGLAVADDHHFVEDGLVRPEGHVDGALRPHLDLGLRIAQALEGKDGFGGRHREGVVSFRIGQRTDPGIADGDRHARERIAVLVRHLSAHLDTLRGDRKGAHQGQQEGEQSAFSHGSGY